MVSSNRQKQTEYLSGFLKRFNIREISLSESFSEHFGFPNISQEVKKVKITVYSLFSPAEKLEGV